MDINDKNRMWVLKTYLSYAESTLQGICGSRLDLYTSSKGHPSKTPKFRVYIEKYPVTILRLFRPESVVSPWFFVGELAVWSAGFKMGALIVVRGARRHV